MEQNRRIDRSLLAILAVVVVIAIATVVVALTMEEDRVAELPADSPERQVQTFVQAIQASDLDTAYDLTASGYRRDVSREQFGNRYRYRMDSPDDTRITIKETIVEGDRATVTLTLTTVYTNDLTIDEYDREERVALVREEGGWRLSRPPNL
jgi:hypothetical protein